MMAGTLLGGCRAAQTDTSTEENSKSESAAEQTTQADDNSAAFAAPSATSSADYPQWRYLYGDKIQELEFAYSDDSVTDRVTDRTYWLLYFAITDIDFDGVPELYHAKVKTENGYYTPMEGSEEIYYIYEGVLYQGTIAEHTSLGLIPEYRIAYTDEASAAATTGSSAEPVYASKVAYNDYGLGKRNGQFVVRNNENGNIEYITKTSDNAASADGYNVYTRLTFDNWTGTLSAEEIFRTDFSYTEDQSPAALTGYTLIDEHPCYYEGTLYDWTEVLIDEDTWILNESSDSSATASTSSEAADTASTATEDK